MKTIINHVTTSTYSYGEEWYNNHAYIIVMVHTYMVVYK